MKWEMTACLALGLVLASAPASGKTQTPWSFDNIAIIDVPVRNLEIVRSADGRGVLLYFNDWQSDYAKEIEDALVRSSLLHRLLPHRQARMVVEVYSVGADVDFAVKEHGRKTQVIVGEIRPGRTALTWIQGGDEIRPLPEDFYGHLAAGRLGVASELLKELGRQKRRPDYLNIARSAVLEAVRRGPSMDRCPKVPSSGLGEPTVQEGILLTAFCSARAGRLAEGLDILGKLEGGELSGVVEKRKTELANDLLATLILAADRRADARGVAEIFLEHTRELEYLASKEPFFELLEENLEAVGIPQSFSSLGAKVMAVASDDDMPRFAPASAEGYLAAGQYVRASDTANFFLSKKQPDWLRGRLVRVRGLAAFQNGDWEQTRKDLEYSLEVLGPGDLDETLALIEARLRTGGDPKELSAQMTEILKVHAQGLTVSQDAWMSRLWGEVELRLGRLPHEEVLAKLPTYVIYEAAEWAQRRGDEKMRKTLLDICAKDREGGWSDLGRTVLEIESLRRELDEISKVMEEEQ